MLGLAATCLIHFSPLIVAKEALPAGSLKNISSAVYGALGRHKITPDVGFAKMCTPVSKRCECSSSDSVMQPSSLLAKPSLPHAIKVANSGSPIAPLDPIMPMLELDRYPALILML